ncbi:Zinc ribbon domain protein [Planctomycetes bacterium Pan216]|uniref:Zinc ribbon domain protein n=1 Tax=Kolteria novifilia TaxID=2527975 RepID=A0A518AXL5_9BACT|nr:Zinc ribbon domain protein [Planctomycetes bacterium Pan216]
MPIFEYVSSEPPGCEHCRGGFEEIQSIKDDALTHCPKCQGPVHRVLSAPTIHGAGRSAEVLSNKNLAEKGFTKYVKSGDGYYEKAAGKGPDAIKR